jgi:hypothetical protein
VKETKSRHRRVWNPPVAVWNQSEAMNGIKPTNIQPREGARGTAVMLCQLRRLSRSRSPALAKALPKLATKDLAEQKLSEARRTEKRRRRRSYLRQAEHRRSNEASKKAPRGVLFCGLAIYAREISRSRNFARLGAPQGRADGVYAIRRGQTRGATTYRGIYAREVILCR